MPNMMRNKTASIAPIPVAVTTADVISMKSIAFECIVSPMWHMFIPYIDTIHATHAQNTRTSTTTENATSPDTVTSLLLLAAACS